MNGQSGVSHSEAQSVSDIVDGLEDTIGIDVLVTSSHTRESVSRFLLGRVQVGVSVMGVAKFILKLLILDFRNPKKCPKVPK